jgi:phosphopantetheine--protein transferase-like protein
MLKVGIDLIKSERLKFILTPGGAAFYERVFTAYEQRVYGYVISSLAACFAAKEAVSKVLSTGLTIASSGVTCQSIEISNADEMMPTVKLKGAALQIAQKSGIDQILLHQSKLGDDTVVFAVGMTGVSSAEIRPLLEKNCAQLVSQWRIQERQVQ